jgi:hypothetical protein
MCEQEVVFTFNGVRMACCLAAYRRALAGELDAKEFYVLDDTDDTDTEQGCQGAASRAC